MPKLSIEYVYHSMYMHHLVICQLTLTLNCQVNLVPYQKSLDTEPINCVGVQIFEHS